MAEMADDRYDTFAESSDVVIRSTTIADTVLPAPGPIETRHAPSLEVLHLAGLRSRFDLDRLDTVEVGKVADLVLYEEDADVARMFGHPRYVIKGGEIVIEEDHVTVKGPRDLDE